MLNKYPTREALSSSSGFVRHPPQNLVLRFKKNLNASKPSEHPPQVEECLKVCLDYTADSTLDWSPNHLTPG